VQIRPTTAEDLDVFVRTVHTAFGRFPETPSATGGLWWSAVEMDRGLLAESEGKVVGTAAAYSFELTLPGNTVVPAAGVSAVTVLPTHRRRGVLTEMMRYQLTELRERGEFLSVLLASEAGIYGRFGYGPATCTRRVTVQSRHSAFRTPVDVGTIEVLPRESATEVMEEVYDRYRRARPGSLSRPPRWWAKGAGMPPVAPAPRYVAVHRTGDVPDGYATYTRDDNALVIDEVIAADDAAFAALARFALDHDLVTEVAFKHLPADHPLLWMLADRRAGEVSGETDWLWVRLLDVPAALTARGWLTDGEIVLDVDDPFLGERRRYLLTVEDGKAECVETTRDPDLELDVRDLGSLYLGGTSPSTLVRAGHVKARASAIEADALFRTERPPHCLHWF
jgi:predicted acetyltransferase